MTTASTPAFKLNDFFSAFATDTSMEKKGAIVPINGVNFKIARSNNKPFAKLLKELVEEHQLVLDQKDEAAEAKSDEIMITVMAKTILLGWEGVVPFKGEELKYSEVNAKKLLAMRDFRIRVSAESDERANYKAKMVAEKVKN